MSESEPNKTVSESEPNKTVSESEPNKTVSGSEHLPLIVGLTGGIGAGKSTVARALAEHGAEVIDMDGLGHLVLEPGGRAYDGLVVEFGQEIVADDGTISRPALGGKVFGDPDALARLNAISHPAINAELAERLQREHEGHHRARHGRPGRKPTRSPRASVGLHRGDHGRSPGRAPHQRVPSSGAWTKPMLGDGSSARPRKTSAGRLPIESSPTRPTRRPCSPRSPIAGPGSARSHAERPTLHRRRRLERSGRPVLGSRTWIRVVSGALRRRARPLPPRPPHRPWEGSAGAGPCGRWTGRTPHR